MGLILVSGGVGKIRRTGTINAGVPHNTAKKFSLRNNLRKEIHNKNITYLCVCACQFGIHKCIHLGKILLFVFTHCIDVS